MKNYTTITVDRDDEVFTVSLNRPKIRNAFNEIMISELLDCFKQLNFIDDIRVVILRGAGKVFCAGADLNWMGDVAEYSYKENYEESYRLSQCFHAIYTCNKPTIAVVHGASIGGANGLMAACDLAYCEAETVFSLSEVKIGIIPACISPYLIKRVGEYGARELMLTGQRIKGDEAERFRLVNRSVKAKNLEDHVGKVLDMLKTSGPQAVAQCKKLIYDVSNEWDLDEALSKTADMIAKIRASEEGQEGMKAFLEKRKPKWYPR